ncbi:ATP-binding protein [Brachybacterium paraconglomeratum]|uniref:ATP-binding protein n=1 Tax=Brachybacterium paraconglomeratum TaxID=173362 RepID=UPI0021A8594E|nr:ATP-binding protein [Brachybacterium paraconglomeratum]MCT1909272.1 ATP-binding protein [Brachybacterium paraconglomeratum]
MRQRVLQATIITVVLVVLMLGIPLGISWLQLANQNIANQANLILDRVRIDTETRLQEDGTIDEALLQRRVDEQTDLNIAVTVVFEGETTTAGDPPGDDPVKRSTTGASGQLITVFIPKSDVRAHTASAWVLITVAGLSALSIGVSVALWQAQRISLPLARLSRRAEEMGSGRARGPWQPSGIAEIDEVAIELARSGAMLNERLEAESRLASDASHQLRTPLTALSMRLDEILATSTEEWVRDEARISLEQIDRLTEVVHDLINAPRSSQRRTPGVVELGTVLTQQSEEWSPAYRRAGRELHIQVPRSAAVWGSTGPLTQVIATLIENALTHGGGRTSVKVRRNDHSTVVEVTDEGGGIDPELGARIFERSVSGRSSGGTGVGLALARTLVEDDGGRLELLTENPATFGVFLISAPGEEPGDDPGAQSGGESGRREKAGRRPRGQRADMTPSGVSGGRHAAGGDDLDSLPQGSVVRRRPRPRA